MKTIRTILEELKQGEIDWIHDQLDGTSMVDENLELVEKDINQALSEIEEIIYKCKPDNCLDNGTDLRYCFNYSIEDYYSNLKGMLK